VTGHRHAGLERRRGRDVHTVVLLHVGALAFDAMPPSEKALVIVRSGLRLPAGNRVARLLIAGGCQNRGWNGERQAT
jgi:hypothetical protein